MQANEVTVLDAAMTSLFHIESQRPGASEFRRLVSSPIRKHQNKMKIQRTLLAVGIVLTSVSCQSDKHASRAVAPRSDVASSKIYYTFDDGFLTYFGPEGVAALEQRLREAHPRDQIQVFPSEPNK